MNLVTWSSWTMPSLSKLRGYTSVNAENLGDFWEILEEKYSIKCFRKLRTYLAIFDLYYIIFRKISKSNKMA